MKIKTTEEAVEKLRAFGPTCSPRELAQVLGGNPYYFNVAAKNKTLGFEFDWKGRNLRIYTESVVKKLLGNGG